MAAQFAAWGDRPQDEISVVFELLSGARAAYIQPESEYEEFWNEYEWIAAGTFVVEGLAVLDDGLLVTVRLLQGIDGLTPGEGMSSS